jgi:hypothetical protein
MYVYCFSPCGDGDFPMAPVPVELKRCRRNNALFCHITSFSHNMEIANCQTGLDDQIYLNYPDYKRSIS